MAAGEEDKPTDSSEEAYADLMANEVMDIQDLAQGAEIQRRMFNCITPSDFSWLQPMFPSVAPFDAKYFDEAFLNGLIGEDTNSVAVYPLSLALDPKTRETLIYNAEGKLIAVVPADGISRTWPEDADPSRVTLQLNLLPVEDAEQYLYVEDRIAESLASGSSRSTKSPRTGGAILKSLGVGEFGFADAEPLTNGNFRLTVTNGADVAEIYSYTVWHTSSVVVATWTNEESNVVTDTNTLWTPVSPPYNGLESEWDCGTTNLVLTNGVGIWEDSNISSNARVRFYGAAKSTDTDEDGLTDGAEIFLYHTDPGVADTDGDGVGDGDEVGHGSDPRNQAAFPVNEALEAALADVNVAQIGYLSYLTGATFTYDTATNYAQRIQQLRDALEGMADSFLDSDVNNGGVLAEGSNVVVWALDTVLASAGSSSGNWLGGLSSTSQVEEIVAVLGKLAYLTNVTTSSSGYPHQSVANNDEPVQIGEAWDLGTGYPENWPTNQTIKTYLFLDTKVEILNVGLGTVDDWIVVNGNARFPSGSGCIYSSHVADISAPVWNPEGTNSLELWDCGDCAGPNDYAYLSPFKVVQVLEAPVLQVDIATDINNDGTIDAADDPIEESGIGEIVRVNDDNDPTSGEDDLQYMKLKIAPTSTQGVVWFTYDTNKVAMWKDLAQTQPIASGSDTSPTWDISADALPDHVYVEGITTTVENASTDLVLHLKVGGYECTDTILFTVTDQVGHYAYFRGIRDYLIENNTEMFLDEVFVSGGFASSADFRLAALRSDKATMQIVNAKNADYEDIGDVTAAFSDAKLIVNGTFYVLSQFPFYEEYGPNTLGRVVQGGSELAISGPTTYPINYRGWLAQNTSGEFSWGRAAEPPTSTPINSAIGGLAAFIPANYGSTYAQIISAIHADNQSQYTSALGHIGLARENQEEILFILYINNNSPFDQAFPNDVDRAGDLFPALVISGASVVLGLDGGGSIGVAHPDINGSLQVQCQGPRHTVSVVNRVNNYIVIEVQN